MRILTFFCILIFLFQMNLPELFLVVIIFYSNAIFGKSYKSNAYRCPDDWNTNFLTRRCYRLITRPMAQMHAQKYCSSLDSKAKLVRIEDKQENDLIQDYTYSGNIWLEAKARFDIIDSKAALFSPGLVLRWKNGKPVKYANWESRNGLSMMDSDHMCVIMNRRGKWTNADCDTKANFVCERKVRIYKHIFCIVFPGYY